MSSMRISRVILIYRVGSYYRLCSDKNATFTKAIDTYYVYCYICRMTVATAVICAALVITCLILSRKAKV